MKKVKMLSLFFAAALLTGCAVSPSRISRESKDEGTSENQQISTIDSQGGETSQGGQGNTSQGGQGITSEYQPPIHTHTHAWEDNWTSDPDYHWHKCAD